MPRKNILQQPITDTHPEKIKFWDYSRNKPKPSAFTFSQNTKVWWVCDVDSNHTWYQSIAVFCKRQADCMVCTRRPVPEYVRLSTRFPDVAKEWHPERNHHLSPDNVRALAKRTAWWRCSKIVGHEWCALIYARTKLHEGCPFCFKSKVRYSESLAACCAELVDWWSDEDNPGLKPDNVLARSSVVVQWCCGCYDTELKLGHKFGARVDQMAERGPVCHLCYRDNSRPSVTLAQGYPHLAAQWHPSKNGDRTPEDFKCGSAMLVWWQCDVAEDHEWCLSVNGRTAKDTGCPFCARRNISSTHSLAVDFPEIAAQWHSRKNGKLTPNNVQPTSLEKIWWRCPVGLDHVWKTTVCDRTEKQTGCPFCANQAVSVTNTLASQYPDIAAEWHRKLNRKLTPKDIVAGYSKKVWWQCRIDKTHEWEAIVAHRTNNGTGCPKCIALRTPKEESLKAQYPKVARDWHPTKNGAVLPVMVRPLTNIKYWWQCRKNPAHSWQATPSNRVGNGSGCPYCAGRIATKETSLKAMYPELAKEWHKERNGDLRPDDLLPKSSKKVWWRCKAGPDHQWITSPSERVVHNTDCPFCFGNKFSTTKSLATTDPEIAKLWHPTKNRGLSPDMVTRGDTRAVWWICDSVPKHIWKSKIAQRVAAINPCSKCYQSKVKPGNTLQQKYPKVAKQWHKLKNGDLTPAQVSPASSQYVWWQCPINKNHVWYTRIANRTLNGSGCPDCWRNR